MALRLTVRVQARSRAPGVERLGPAEFRVRVAAAPEKGKANKEVLERLAGALGTAPSRLRIVRGGTHSLKIVEADVDPRRGGGTPGPERSAR